jgi:hypothetical protein
VLLLLPNAGQLSSVWAEYLYIWLCAAPAVLAAKPPGLGCCMLPVECM